MSDFGYEGVRRIWFKECGATFVPVCETCGRFVKADYTICTNEMIGLLPLPNATCTKCGRTKMIFEGFI